MKTIGLYWIFGCMLMGAVYGSESHRCPNDKMPPASELVAYVAVWPLFLMAAIGAHSDKKPSACDAPVAEPQP